MDLQCQNYYCLLDYFSSKFQSSLTISHYKSGRMQNIPNFIFGILDKLKVRWDDNICMLIPLKEEKKRKKAS